MTHRLRANTAAPLPPDKGCAYAMRPALPLTSCTPTGRPVNVLCLSLRARHTLGAEQNRGERAHRAAAAARRLVTEERRARRRAAQTAGRGARRKPAPV